MRYDDDFVVSMHMGMQINLNAQMNYRTDGEMSIDFIIQNEKKKKKHWLDYVEKGVELCIIPYDLQTCQRTQRQGNTSIEVKVIINSKNS